MAIIDPFKPAAPAAGDAPKIKRPRINDPFAGATAITRPKQPESPGFGGSFVRGLQRSLPETKSLLYGATAAVGGAVGADGVRDWGLENYRRVQRDEVQPLANETGFVDAISGKGGGVAEWAGDTLGNFAGQALQSGAAALAGGAAGTAGGPGGSVAGAVGGVLARGVVKKAVEGQVAKMLIARPVAATVTREAAEAAARQQVLRRLGGAAIAGTGLNVAQETGIGYTGRAEDAAAAGEQLTPGDAARAIAFGVPAGLVDTAAEGLVAGRLMRGVSSNPSLLKRVGAGAAIGAATEGLTEGTQAVLERAGAARDLTGPEAYRDYVENVAAGALGGGVAGGPSGLRRVQRPVIPGEAQQQDPQQLTRRPLAITRQPAEPVVVDPDGNATTGLQRHEERQVLIGRGMELRDTGQTGDVRQARTQHPGYAPDGMPIIRRPQVPFPNAVPGSLSDAGNSLPQGQRQPATIDGATGQLLSSAPPAPGGTQGEPIAFSATPVVPPWVDQSTGEILPATPELLKEAVRRQMLSQYEQDGTMRMSPLQLAQSWGVRASEVKSARTALLQESAAARRLGMPDPLDTTQRQEQQAEPISAGGAGQAQAAPAGPISGAAALLPSAPPPVAEPFAQQPAPSPAQAPRQGQASSSPTAAERTYDESPDVLDTDITPSWGTAYTQQAAAELAARRQGGGAKAVPVDGGFVVRMPIPAVPEPTNERAGAEPTSAGGVAPGGGSVAPAPAAPDAAGATAAPPVISEGAPGQAIAPTMAATGAAAPSPAVAAVAPESTLRGRLERFRTPAGEELVRFRQRNANGFVRVRRADLDNAALPVLPLYNSAGAKLTAGLGSTVLRRDLVNIAPLRGVPDAQQGWVSPAPAGTTAPQGAQQESVDVAGPQQDQASTIDAQVTQQPEPPIGDASSPAPGVPALGNIGSRATDSADGYVYDESSEILDDDITPSWNTAYPTMAAARAAAQQIGDGAKAVAVPLDGGYAVRMPLLGGERRADAGQRAAIDALPQDERDAEIQRLRTELAQAQQQLDADSLTGTRSREAYRRDAPNAKGVAFIDLIAFKGYNTKFTETGGDAVLSAFGRQLVETAPGSAYRRGGDEFAFLSDRSPEHAAQMARAAKARLDRLVLELDDKDGAPHQIRGIPFRFGIGATDAAAVADNAKRKLAGDRESNPNVVRLGQSGSGEGAVQRQVGDPGERTEAVARSAAGESADSGGSGAGRESVAQPQQNPETPAQAGVSAFGVSVSDLLRSATRNTRLQGAIADPVAADVLEALGKDGAAALDQALVARRVRPRAVLAGGAGSIVLDAGDRVVRLGRSDGQAPERVRSPLVLQAESSGTAGNARWEVLPKVETQGITDDDVATMQERLRSAGLEFADPGADNLGRRADGELVVIDAGAVRPARSTVDAAAAAAATSPENDLPLPTAAQKEAGNYPLGHIRLHGLDISIENPAGTSRRPEWTPLANHYGYIRRTEGADGDHVDVFLGPGAEDAARPVFVIDQVDPKSGKFDEHKVVMGAATGREARKIYQANYAPGWKGFGAITNMTLDQFKAWLQGDTSKPASTTVPAAPARQKAAAVPGNDQTSTPAFKNWFGDSKVVDASGRPMVMYHGTNKTEHGEAFTMFDAYASNYGLFGQGAYFTDDPAVASEYTRKGKGSAPTVYPVYMSIKKPIDMDQEVGASRAAWEKAFADVDFDASERSPRTGDNFTNEDFYRIVEDHYQDEQWEKFEAAEAIQNGLRAMGYDGITHVGGGRVKSEGVRHRVFIAFDPEQIKSATGNTGAFDPKKPDIRFSKPEPVRQASTQQFKNWFRNSKVVDENSEPLVVYHGTTGDFTAFDPGRAGQEKYSDWGQGIYFTPSPGTADYYRGEAAKRIDADSDRLWGLIEAEEEKTTWKNGAPTYTPEHGRLLGEWRKARASAENRAGSVLPVYLSIQNPLIQEYSGMPDPGLSDRAKSAGHDGIIVLNGNGGIDEIVAFRPSQIKSALGNSGAFDPANPDIRFSRPAAASAPTLNEAAVRDTVAAVTKDWGPAGPRVRVLADAEQLPRAAKSDPDYKTAEGYYDGQTVYLTAPNLRSAERVQQVLAHEAIGHYGVDRIIDEHVEGGWAKLSADIDRLRKDRSLGSKDMRAVLDAVERRYPGADTDTFARETLAVMAEKDVRNGLISRAIAAIKAWLRKFIHGYNPTEKQLRGLLDKSHRLLRAGPNYAQRAAAVQSMSFSQKAPPFYSAMVESVRKAQGAPKSGTAGQWKGWLDGAQRRGEFKQSERDWMGVDQWLDEQASPVSREQLNAFVNANAVSLGETIYAKPDTTWTQADQDRWAELTDTFADLSADERAELDELNRRALYGDQVEAGDPGVARYSSYTLPGGKGYRELMMTLPPTAGRADFDNRHHFPGMKNILVHVRFNERTDASGKRVLHVEEVQSDWHQHGRRFGYSSESIMDIDRLRAVEVRPGEWEVQDGRGDETDGRIYFERARAESRAEEDNRALAENAGITPAPLRRTEDWALLGMKRAIRWAAENGFERVTWTTGQQQAERYDLRKQIDMISWRKGGDTYDITTSKDGDVIAEYDGLTEPELADAIGKEPADRIIAQGQRSGRNRGQLSGLDLAVGGAGMKSFYDKMLPKAVAGYVKKWGAKVGTTTIETGQSELTDDGDLVPEKLTVHSLDLTPAMVDSVIRGQPLFSRPDASVDALDQVLAQPDGGAWQRAKEWIKGKWQDFQPTALGALTLRHVLELAEPLLPGAKRYADLVQQIGADRNIMLERAGGLSDRLQKWARGGKLFGGYIAEARAMFDLVHRSTIEGSDPSKPYSPMHFEDGRGRPVAFSPEAVKERKKALLDQMRGRSGDDKARMMEELKFLDRLPGIERARKEAYPGLIAAWQQLSPEAQKFYAELRDHYVNHSNEVEKALVKRINALDVPEQKKQALAAKIRYQFETQRLQGVYFPLQRFGEFWVSATDKDGEHAYLMFENAKEWTRAQAKLRGAGFTITATGRKDQNYSAKDAPSGTFVADVIRELQSAHVTEKVQDQVYQLFLKSLPELSMRKHSIHRKATAGFSDDAARAFAKNAFHGAHQLSRLRYAHELQSTLEAMRVLADNRRKEGLPAAEVNAMDALLGEMARRHDWIMSPTDSKVANYASAIGFAYYLGVTPAAALVNLTQGALTTFPVLGAQHGFDKAGRMLSAATRDAMRTWGNIDRVLQSDEERAAFKTLLERGDIQRTAAHNLAGIAEGSDLQANPIWAKTMHGISYVFQKMEEINRQAAGIAAFRMARSAGQDFNAAVKYASEIINRTHYDFSNANRARFMQSAPAKVLLMFRQYALNTSWLLGRATYKAFAGESPEVKREARRTLAGVLGMSALFSGAMGLPFMGIASTVANAIQAAFGDDDEPWDFNTEVRNFLAGMLGPEAARWVADGAVNRAGADVASRVSMSQMWFRDADRELEGQDAYYNLLEQAAGPMGGIVKNLLVGKKQVDDGHVWRGIETMMPKAIKDAMKSLRFADEGANTLRGDPILEDVTTAEKFVQLMGFSPTRLGEQYRVNRAVKNYEQHVLDRRASLLSALALSVRLKDEEMRAAAVEKIQAFNRAHPEIALTQKGIAQSLRARARYSREAENGIVLNKRLAERARESVEFAD